jgi:hypothetical protein
MAAFNFQYSNLVLMIFKQVVIAALILMAFTVDITPTRNSILPNFMIPGAVNSDPTK